MESILQVMPGKRDRTGHALTSVREQEVEKCHLASRDLPPSSSPAIKQPVETVGTVENLKNSEDGDNGDYPESVASECSMESNASSNVPEDDCGDDAVSPALEEKNMRRCPSGGSIVTYDEAASKLREEGECERTRDRKTTTRRPEGSHSSGFNDNQETSINACQEMAGSAGPAWTDDKHCSYLNSIEQTFVQSMYGQDYHTVDAPGQDDQDCVESRPMYGNPYGRELFTSLQRGCYDQREYYRPQFLHTFGPSPSVFLSPWIQHFNPRTATPSHGTGGAGQDSETFNPATGLAESAGNFGSGDVKEEVKESVPNLNYPETGFQVPLSWSSRYQSQHHASTSTHVRADTNIQAKKRNCNLDPVSDGTYRPKKLRATQRWLAEIDVELDEQFVLKQKNLKEHQPLGGVNRGIDLNQELVDEEETNHEDTQQTTPTAVTETIDFVSYFREPTMTSNKGSAPEESLKKSYVHKSGQDTFRRQPPAGVFGEGTSGVNKFVDATTGDHSPPGFRTRQDETYGNHQADSGFDDEEEFEFLLRRSPRASKTYTWGGIGPRRRLHNECNVLVETAAPAGSVIDARDHELPKKGNCD